MKRKPLIALALVLMLALCAVGWWLASRQTRPAARPLRSSPQPEAVVPASAPFPSRPIKLMVVGARPKPQSPANFNLPKPAWTDIRLIVNAKADYHQRAEAIAHLPAQLSDADWEALQGFLLRKDPADKGQLGQVLKNQLLDQLCALQPPPSGLGDVLARMYRDHSQNEVLRDYAVQHLATLGEELAAQADPAAARAGQAAQKVLWEALKEMGGSIGGTALLGLERLSRAGAPVDQDRLRAAALEMAGNVAGGELSRITAYQTCAQLGVAAALPLIEEAAQRSPSLPLQISAVGALGLLGGTNDLPLLQRLLAGNDERLQLPVERAIGRIEQRQGQPPTRPGPNEEKENL